MLQATHSAKAPLKRHTTEIRVGAGGYATMAEAIAYVNSQATLDTQHRVRLLVDNGTYNEAFALPQYCDIDGESKTGVIFQYNDGDNIYADDWVGRPAFLTFPSDSLVKDITVSVVETTALIAGVAITNGETLVSGRYDNIVIDCSKAAAALVRGEAFSTIFDVVDYYLSTIVSNSELIAGGNYAVGFGSGSEAYIGSIVFEDTDITGGEQLQAPAPAFSSVGFTEFWAVFFGNTLAKVSHQIRSECSFIRSNVKQYDAPWVTRGLQAFNLEYSVNIGSYANCIDSTFETVRDSPADGKHGTPLFISGYAQNNLKVNPNAYFSCFTDGCTFTKNSTYVPSLDIRYYNNTGEDTAPTVTWGGTGTNPTLGETSGE